MTAHTRPVHWRSADPLRDITAEAWRPGAAPPREIRVRPEVYTRLLIHLDGPARDNLRNGRIGHPVSVPIVIDGAMPPFPGYEVHRIHPTPGDDW